MAVIATLDSFSAALAAQHEILFAHLGSNRQRGRRTEIRRRCARAGPLLIVAFSCEQPNPLLQIGKIFCPL